MCADGDFQAEFCEGGRIPEELTADRTENVAASDTFWGKAAESIEYIFDDFKLDRLVVDERRRVDKDNSRDGVILFQKLRRRFEGH